MTAQPFAITSQPPAEPDLSWEGISGHEAMRLEAQEDAPVARTTRYEVRDRTGTLWGTHVRRDASSGRKRMHWEDADGATGLGGIPLSSAPLYGIHRLESPWVIVTEGEKAAQALIDAGLPAVGTVTGASGSPGRAPLADLEALYVYLWPDADDVGRDHMARLAAALDGVAAAVATIQPPEDAPAGWDAADAMRVPDATALIDGLLADAVPMRPQATEAPSAAKVNGIDAADLLAMDLPPLVEVIPGLLPEGSAVLASPPKVGKSCLVYQIGVEVAIGGQLFGRRVQPGSVLYLALEDGQRRGQERLRAALAGRTMPRGRLEVRWSAPRLGEGLEDELREWLDTHPDAALVAIDTLGRVRSPGDSRANAYAVDVQDLGRLQELFRNRGVALLIVHHLKKDVGDDFLASVSGTYGITGSVDTIIVIRRKRMEAFGTISVTGREVREDEISVRFDGMTWSEAPGSVSEGSFSRQEVYQAILRRGPVFAKAIADELGLERTNVQHRIDALVKDGVVQRIAKGYIAIRFAMAEPAEESADEGTLAHARTRYVPPVTLVTGESDGSDGGHTRAHPREADPAQRVPCANFVAHQSAHRRDADGSWVCDRCQPEARP